MGFPGVGILFNPALTDFVDRYSSVLDYLAVIPDRAWTDSGPGSGSRFMELPLVTAAIDGVARNVPIVMHSIGMSICSAAGLDEEYVTHLANWRSRYACPWMSDHLSFTRFGGVHETNAALALPVPFDREVLDLLVPRARHAGQRMGCPFLLENNVAYIRFPGEELSEVEFLNQLAVRSGCGILLDLHNLHTNARNHGTDPRRFLESLDPSVVLEVHVAGGDEMMGFHTDSHAGPVLEEVWELLAFVAPRLVNLRGVTFEFHESSWPLLHDRGVLAQVERARAILGRAFREPGSGDR